MTTPDPWGWGGGPAQQPAQQQQPQPVPHAEPPARYAPQPAAAEPAPRYAAHPSPAPPAEGLVYVPAPPARGPDPYSAEQPVNLYAVPAPAFTQEVAPLTHSPVFYTPAPDSRPARVAPAEWGWRGRVRRLTGGAVKLRPREAELTYRAAITTVRATFPAARCIVVANQKGGAGKTPTTIILADRLAELRRESTVGWDVNELRGTLGYRAEVSDPDSTITDVLARAEWLGRPDAEVGDLAGMLRRQPGGSLILASSQDASVMEQIGEAECATVSALLRRRYGTIIIDTGNNAAASNFLYSVDTADVLVVPTAPDEDHLIVVDQLLTQLSERESTRHLVGRAIMVVTSESGRHLPPDAVEYFGRKVGRILEVPPDPTIAAGGKIRLTELSIASQRAWTLVAAAVAEVAAQPSPHDVRPTFATPRGPAQ